MKAHDRFLYVPLALAWLLLAGWQALEHQRVRDSAFVALRNQAYDISHSISAVVRVGRPGMIRLDRLQDALNELARSEELEALALLNAGGEIVAAAGRGAPISLENLPEEGFRFNNDGSATFVNLVDFGDGGTTRPTTIVLPDFEPPPGGEDRWRERRPSRGSVERSEPGQPATTGMHGDQQTSPGLTPGMRRERRPGFSPGGGSGPGAGLGLGRGEGPMIFRRPSWMSPQQYEELLRKQGLHGFVINLSSAGYDRAVAGDLWLRGIIIFIGLLAGAGAALAWQQVRRSARLELRLVRASELNMHLQEMNLAAAGLAHETRNPLNIIRVLAQLIAGHETADEEVRRRSGEIIEEVDRVTFRLNEFITYSRPPEPHPAPLNLVGVVRDVERTLEVDLREKEIALALEGPEPVVMADEGLLRQVLFNLLLNAIQSVPTGGRIEVRMAATAEGETAIEVRDDGPGVPADQHQDIFRPYFTTRAGGTGLGLAVVRQIALAHHWEIEYLADAAVGATFRLTGIRPAARATQVAQVAQAAVMVHGGE